MKLTKEHVYFIFNHDLLYSIIIRVVPEIFEKVYDLSDSSKFIDRAWKTCYEEMMNYYHQSESNKRNVLKALNTFLHLSVNPNKNGIDYDSPYMLKGILFSDVKSAEIDEDIVNKVKSITKENLVTELESIPLVDRVFYLKLMIDFLKINAREFSKENNDQLAPLIEGISPYLKDLELLREASYQEKRFIPFIDDKFLLRKDLLKWTVDREVTSRIQDEIHSLGEFKDCFRLEKSPPDHGVIVIDKNLLISEAVKKSGFTFEEVPFQRTTKMGPYRDYENPLEDEIDSKSYISLIKQKKIIVNLNYYHDLRDHVCGVFRLSPQVWKALHQVIDEAISDDFEPFLAYAFEWMSYLNDYDLKNRKSFNQWLGYRHSMRWNGYLFDTFVPSSPNLTKTEIHKEFINMMNKNPKAILDKDRTRFNDYWNKFYNLASQSNT